MRNTVSLFTSYLSSLFPSLYLAKKHIGRSWRRKLTEKLRESDDKLRPIKANWQRFSSQVGPEHKVRTHKMTNQVQEIIGEVPAVAPSETAQNLPLNESCRFDELFAETQSQ